MRMVIQRWREYAFALDHLKPQMVLDVGCCDSHFGFLLADCALTVTAIDIRDMPEFPFYGGRANFTFRREDILETKLPDRFFDSVVAISTIEHIGLLAYENKKEDKEGDLKAVQQIKRVLKDDGVFIMTVPYGLNPAYWYRVYNRESLAKLLSGFKIEAQKWYGFPSWNEISEEEASRVRNEAQEKATVCVSARKEYKAL